MASKKDAAGSGGSEAVGAYLRFLREAAGMTVAEIAANINIDASQIRRIERGKSDPKSRTLFRFTELVGGDVHDIALLINNPDATSSDGTTLAKLRRSKAK